MSEPQHLSTVADREGDDFEYADIRLDGEALASVSVRERDGTVALSVFDPVDPTDVLETYEFPLPDADE